MKSVSRYKSFFFSLWMRYLDENWPYLQFYQMLFSNVFMSWTSNKEPSIPEMLLLSHDALLPIRYFVQVETLVVSDEKILTCKSSKVIPTLHFREVLSLYDTHISCLNPIGSNALWEKPQDLLCLYRSHLQCRNMCVCDIL